MPKPPKKFKFKGKPKPPFLKKLGRIVAFEIRLSNGTIHRINAPNQNVGFKPNDILDIPDDILSMACMKPHPYFEEHPGNP